jgi:hypothetical protein
VFHVSDSQDLAKENFKPRYVEGEMLGSEWDEAIARYWRERDHVREMKRVNEFCVGLGFGALEWLERQEGEVRGWIRRMRRIRRVRRMRRTTTRWWGLCRNRLVGGDGVVVVGAGEIVAGRGGIVVDGEGTVAGVRM